MEASLPAPKDRDSAHPTVSRDVAVVVAVTLITFALAAGFELNERLLQLTRPLEFYQLDELPVTVFAMAMALAWFAWRRWQSASVELARRLKAQQELAEREAEYRKLFTENLAGNLILDADGVIRQCNPALADILRLGRAEQAVGRRLAEFFPDPAFLESCLHQALDGQKTDVQALTLRAADGRPAEAIARFVGHRPPGRPAQILAYLAEITELQLVQRDLADTLAENRLLAQKYVQAQEAERRNIARELHDDMGQYLNAIKLDAVAIRDSGTPLPPAVDTGVRAIIAATDHVYELARGLTQRLRPVALDTLGLSDAIRHCIQEWARRNVAVACSLHLDGPARDLGERANITLYRLVQECLTNITRHAHASRVAIRLRQDEASGDVLLSVSDDGVGWDQVRKSAGLGLLGLRERVESLGGRFEVRSGGRGFEVLARVPAVATTA
jgi:PAS domain S-box-containing protein